MDNTEEFRCISLCSGYAGLELGIRRVIPNLRTIVYVEVETFACANLVSKMEAGKLDVAPIWTDIKTFDGKPFHKRIHLITAGYPCQPFSVAGKRQGTADPRHLWPYIARIVQAVRPVWCFFENVSGHLSIGFSEVYRSLRLMGYKVEAGLFTAEEVGAPHKRERLFILSHAESDRQQRPRTGMRTDNFRQLLQKESRPSELADSDKARCEEQRRAEPIQQKYPTVECCRWPSRPTQPQYEWEEPRVVAYNNIRQSNTRVESEPREKKISQSRTDCNKKENRQTQSRLGRESDGNTVTLDIAKGIRGGYYVKPGGEIGHNLVMEAKQRVDRLRLLGNGVIPAQAELAFRVLYEKQIQTAKS